MTKQLTLSVIGHTINNGPSSINFWVYNHVEAVILSVSHTEGCRRHLSLCMVFGAQTPGARFMDSSVEASLYARQGWVKSPWTLGSALIPLCQIPTRRASTVKCVCVCVCVCVSVCDDGADPDPQELWTMPGMLSDNNDVTESKTHTACYTMGQ